LGLHTGDERRECVELSRGAGVVGGKSTEHSASVRDAPYRSGRSPDWIKVKNPDAPAATRVME